MSNISYLNFFPSTLVFKEEGEDGAPAAAVAAAPGEEDTSEEAMLQRALAMSMDSTEVVS